MKKLNVNVNGNRKLQNNDKVRYMIWNLPSVTTCPYRTKNCESLCYAKKAEKIYPQVLPSRIKNYEDSLKADFVKNMIYTIETRLNSKAFKDKKVVFRIHESGDFYSLEYARKWIHICKHFENDNRIVFLAYTKSIIYLINLGFGLSYFPKNLRIRASVWNDTEKDQLDLIKAYNFNIYTALSKEDLEKEKDFYKCECVNCSKCLQCINKNQKRVICEIH